MTPARPPERKQEMSDTEPRKPRQPPDPAAWVDRYGDALYAYALQRVQDPTIAEDLVQESLLAGLNSLTRFRGESSEKTWLTGILKYKILDYFRRRYREQPIEDVESAADTANNDYTAAGRWLNRPARWSVDPVAALEQREFMETVHRCLEGLSQRLAHAFAMRELDGETTAAICKVLNISTTNCWVMLHRARAAMRRCLESNWLTP